MTGTHLNIVSLHKAFKAAAPNPASTEAVVYEYARRLGNMSTYFYPEYPGMAHNKMVERKMGELLKSLDVYCRENNIGEVTLQAPSRAFCGLVTKAARELAKAGEPVQTKIRYAKYEQRVAFANMVALPVPVQFPA